MDKTIKLATYNIVHCLDFSTFKKGDNPGELSVNIEGLAKAVKTLDADIIGLNEVYNTTVFERSPEHGCQAQKIASIVGYPFSVFGRGYLFTHNGQDIGNAILSRYMITSLNTYPILAPTEEERRPNENEWYEDRIIVKTEVDFNGEKICVISTHFGLNYLERERMVDKLIEIIDETKIPLIVMGDFNSTPTHERKYIQPLFDRLISATAITGKELVPTFSTYDPKLPIDYIFVSKHFEVLDCDIPNLKNSDHFPVTATVKLK